MTAQRLLTELRFKHYQFWHSVLMVIPIFRECVKHANRWCFVEMQILSIGPAPKGNPSQWAVRFKAGDRELTEEGHTIVEAIERAMKLAEFIERVTIMKEDVETARAKAYGGGAV